MDSSNHAQLVASMKDAENERNNGDGTLFLIQLATAATLDENPKYSLKEVYDALLDAQTWSLVDPLNLLPLLVTSDEDTAQDLIQLVAREGNAKETIIFVQEALERLERAVPDGKQSNQKKITQLICLLAICRESIPRLQLRRRGPAETLRPILTHLGTTIEAIASLCRGDDCRNVINSVSNLIQSTVPWLSRYVHSDDPHDQNATDILLNLLYTTLTACANHIRASLAQRKFEMYNPKLIIRTNIDHNSERGMEVMQKAVGVARTLGVTPKTLTSSPLSLGKLILLAYEDPPTILKSSECLQKLIPVITSALQQNIAMDESLALLQVFIFASSHQLPPEIVDPLATLITPLASTHRHPPTRHIAFRTLGALLSRAPPPVHLAHLSSLLTDCPFPPMRVAAVGLVKESFLNAITSTENDQSLFKSKMLVHSLAPTLFRPDPPDLFTSPTRQSFQKFLESSEPARLTECLAFYYVLLKRDTANSTGIRDRDLLRTVENNLLSPLRNALTTWLDDPSCAEDPHALMPIASLETSLERVDAAVATLILLS